MQATVERSMPMRKLFLKKISGVVFGISMLAVSAVNALAASADCIDMNVKGRFTIHKYDMTAAKEGGVTVETAGFANSGKADSTAEEALKNYAIQGVEFAFVRVGDIHTDSEGGRLQLSYDIPDALEAILMKGVERENNRYTSTELNRALVRTLSEHTTGKNALEQFVGNAEGKQPLPMTDEQGETGASDLPLGLYLVAETKVPANVHTTTDPFFLSLPMTDVQGDGWFYEVEVYPKNQTDIPDLDKLVRQRDDAKKEVAYADTATASTGEVVDYIFVSHLPGITSETTFLKQYTFVDKMDYGLGYNDDFTICFYESEEEARANNRAQAQTIWEKDSLNFTVEYGTVSGGVREADKRPLRTVAIRMTDTGLEEINRGMSRMYMTVAYSCTVNADVSAILGDHGNINETELTWERTSSEYTDTISDRAKLYIFGLDIQKNFEQQEGKNGNPQKVQFVLQNQTDGYFVTAAEQEDGVYYVTDRTKEKQEENASAFVPAENGRLLINGLEADTYVLTELATDDGYTLLREPMTIDIKSTVDELIPSKSTLYDRTAEKSPVIEVKGERANALVDDRTTNMSAYRNDALKSENARVDLTILNSRSFGIPKTGDDGIFLFPLAGCTVALAGVALLLKRLGKKQKDV